MLLYEISQIQEIKKALEEKNTQALRRKRILCVEDDKDNCEILRFVLTEYEFVFAHTFQEAVSMIETEKFDLYVLDNWLPGGSGVELCRKIRALDLRVPVIFISGAVRSSDIDEAIKAGAQKYIIKPYDHENLQKIVKELIEKN